VGRLTVVLILTAGVAVFYLAGLHREWTFDRVRSNVDDLRSAGDSDPFLAIVAFAAVYVVVTGLSLPVASLLSLLAGALFGRWLGTATVSVAATAGATLAMLSARYVLRDWVQRRFGHRLAMVNRGIERDGAYYLLTLRLVPLVPFWLINLGMGLTPIRTRTFALVSWVGMLPGAFLYVNAGTELAQIRSPADVLTLRVLGAFLRLALVPLLLRLALRRPRAVNA
jgi:uncharacterized membrane protein YdjX (TVP38/TMEM64 family)